MTWSGGCVTLKDAQTDDAAMTRNSHAGLDCKTLQTNCVRYRSEMSGILAAVARDRHSP